MSKQTIKEINQAPIKSCDKLLEDFFFVILEEHKDLDSQTVQILRDLYKKGQLRADNITKTLQEKRNKLYE